MRKMLAVMLLFFAGQVAAQTLQWAIAPLDDRGDPIRPGFAALVQREHVAALDGAGNLFIAGRSNRPDGFPESERQLLGKYASSDGSQQWRFIGPVGSFLFAVAVNTAGDAFVAGFVDAGGIEHQYVARISGVSGTVMWQAVDVPGSTTENFGVDIVVGTDGNPVVMGRNLGRAVVTKYAADTGAVMWSVVPGADAPSFQTPFGIQADRDGNIVGITFTGDAINGPAPASFLFKLDGATGARIWGTPWTYRTGEIQAFTLDGLGKPTLAGKGIAKFSNVDGTLNWQRPLADDGTPSLAFDVAAASNGDILVSGTQGANSSVVTTARLRSADGATVWMSKLGGTDPAQASQIGKSIALDASGNVLVAASPFFVGAANYELATLRYAGVTGELLNALRYDGGAGGGKASADLELTRGDAAYTLGSFVRPTDTFATALKYTGIAASNPPRLFNISTRGDVLTGDDVMIGGFVIGGSVPKTVAVVATGPALASAGVANALADPTLTLVRSSDGAVLAVNDNWQDAANAAELQATGFAPTDARESAILMTLPPGAYTAIVRGVNGSTGTSVVAVYEVDHPEAPLANISTRGKVLTGDDVLIGGLIIQGDTPQTVVVTAIGPSMTSAGVPGVLANPMLTLVRSSDHAIIAANDDWQSAPNAADIAASGFAPGDARESAILVTLPPGAYTAIVQGVGGTTGVGLVGVFAAQ